MTQAPTTPIADPVAAPCRSCAAPLAPDQRYCLSCGARVAASRVDYLALLAGAAGAANGAAAPATGGARTARSLARQLDRVGGPMGAAAVVLVALGVGFLFGQGAGDSGPATVIQRPPIVNVQSSGVAAGPADSGTTTSGADGRGGGGGKRGGADTKGVPKATTENTGGDIDKQRQQPIEQATQGAPPKTDHKAAGGGSAVETIG